MYILGISCHFHDSSATLIKDGKIIAAAEEERFTKIKHDNSFPTNAIQFCLDYAQISSNDLEAICFYEKPLIKLERIIKQHIKSFPNSFQMFLRSFYSWATHKPFIKKIISKNLNYKGKIYFCTHHESHAASAFFVSPFKKAAFLTVDGVGEKATTSFGIGIENNIQTQKEIHFPNSLGLLYSTLTAYLGFSVNNSEYKVMGLAAYGNQNRETNRYYAKIMSFLTLHQDGSFSLDMKYFDFDHALHMPSSEMCKTLGGQIRKNESKVTQRHKDIAAATQLVYEDAFFNMINYVYSQTKMTNLVLAGGCALNSVANGKILQKSKFKRIFIQPNSGDGGGSLGAALFCYNQILGKKERYLQQDAFLGPKYPDETIKQFLDEKGIVYTRFENTSELLKKTASLIYKNKIVGWFQGRMEWGPRALGCRSILANPCNKNMMALLNRKVKHREKFRPFAPAICAPDINKFFESDKPLPLPTDFMLLVYPIKKKWHKKLPSITHVDGSGRLQVVRKKSNYLFYSLIKEFETLSGAPIVINTSFNIRGQPIVMSPKDAFDCMMGTGIDYLIIGSFLIKKSNNTKFKTKIKVSSD